MKCVPAGSNASYPMSGLGFLVMGTDLTYMGELQVLCSMTVAFFGPKML